MPTALSAAGLRPPLFRVVSGSMPTPKTLTKAETLWTCLRTDTDELDANGDIAFHFTLQHETGIMFVVSVHGPGRAKASTFVEALRAASAVIALNLGGSIPGTRLLNKLTEIN